MNHQFAAMMAHQKQGLMMKAIAYIRVSTEEQASTGVSLDAQREKIAAYASLYDLDIIETISDAGISGKTMDRPGLQRALDMLRTGKAGALVVVKLDRLTRSVRDLGHLIEDLFSSDKVALLSVSEQIDTRSAAGRFMLNILGSVAQWERETIAERTATALGHKKAHRRVYNHVPLGFDRDGDNLVKNEGEAGVVAKISEWHRAGVSMNQIARNLNGAGVVGKSGGKFYASTVRAILGNTIHQMAA